MKKEKSRRKKIIIKLFIIILLILLILFIANGLKSDKNDSSKIIATKVEQVYDKKTVTNYEIKIKDFNLGSIKKTIEFNSDIVAQAEFKNLEYLNKNLDNILQIELKKKKIVLVMPADYFLEEIGYENDYNILLINDDNSEKRVINQDKIKELLANKGFEIK